MNKSNQQLTGQMAIDALRCSGGDLTRKDLKVCGLGSTRWQRLMSFLDAHCMTERVAHQSRVLTVPLETVIELLEPLDTVPEGRAWRRSARWQVIHDPNRNLQHHDDLSGIYIDTLVDEGWSPGLIMRRLADDRIYRIEDGRIKLVDDDEAKELLEEYEEEPVRAYV